MARLRSRSLALVASGFVLPLGLVTGCGTGDGGGTASESPTTVPASTESSPTMVLATTSIWADVVSRVACVDGVDVRSIVPNGGDAHGFEPTLADRAQLDDAVLIVANGLLLEEGLTDALDAAEASGTPVFRVAEHVTTIAYGAGDDHDEEQSADDEAAHADEDDHGHDEETAHADEDDHGHDEEKAHDDDETAHADEDDHGHGHDGDDPHVWQDPRRVAAIVPELAEVLIEAGLDGEAIEACADAYVTELEELDAQVEATLSDLANNRRLLVTSHDSMGYFADRYGFEVIGTVSPSSSGLAEPNPADLERLVATIERTGVPAIFVEPQKADGDARAVADRIDGIVVASLFTDSLGDEGSGAETYVDLVRTNAEVIADALGGQ